jgi:predicted DNA-binding protein (UPF0251 family)
MPRPVKWRRVQKIPKYKCFVPVDVPKDEVCENILKVEEIEAIRLRDLEGLEQVKCAEKMEISRQTFQRIYNEGKFKIADSLINGKAIRVEGGNYTQNICKLVCEKCGNTWQERIEDVSSENEECPKCGSHKMHCCKKIKNNICNKKCKNK